LPDVSTRNADGDAWLVLASAYVHGWVCQPHLGFHASLGTGTERRRKTPRRGLFRYLLLIEHLGVD
jgi:hypothetical protein